MARLSQQTKEILQIVIFLLVTGLLLTFYVIYPLNRAKAYMARLGLDDFKADSLPPNDPSLFTESGLAADTFWLDADGLTRLACIYIRPIVDSIHEPRGTIILIHDEKLERRSMLPIAIQLSDQGFAVALYDQRASGLSGGKYHGEGQLEASDLTELIRYLDIREKSDPPLIPVGFSLGGDAALLASREEKRIAGFIAVDPYLSTDRMLAMYKKEQDAIWFPFFRTVIWWWYEMRSGSSTPYRRLEDIKPINRPALLIVSPESLNSEEYRKLQEISDKALLTVQAKSPGDSALVSAIMAFADKLTVLEGEN